MRSLEGAPVDPRREPLPPPPPPWQGSMGPASAGRRGALCTLAALFSAALVPTALAAGPSQQGAPDRLADRPTPGALAAVRLHDDRDVAYYAYVPRTVAPGAPLVVSVHGISRNAHEHAARLAPLAERYGAVLLAPVFDEQRFPDYQRLGRSSRGERADHMLERIVAEVAAQTGADARRLYLFGFSGGGQFVHRFAMAHPERVASYVVGAAGWYTFPDAAVPFPRGTRARRCLDGVCFDPDRYLRVPALVLVGERDVHEGSALRRTAKVMDQQGESRLERGEHWVAAMQDAARARGYTTRFAFETLERSGHSFRRAAKRGRIGERIFAWFFGPANGHASWMPEADDRVPAGSPDLPPSPRAASLHPLRLDRSRDGYAGPASRHVAGGMPNARSSARLNAASVS